MSVLDTFLILFESDASDVKKGTDEANKSAETLDKTLDKIGASTDGLTESMSEFSKVALGSLAAFLSLGGAIGGTIEKAEEIDALSRAAQSLSMPIEDIDAWEKLPNGLEAKPRVCGIRSPTWLKKWVRRLLMQHPAQRSRFRS